MDEDITIKNVLPTRVLAGFSEDLQEQLLTLRRDLHRFPELSFQEFKTQERLDKALRELGIQDIKKVANTGLIARIKGTDPTAPTVCIRGDIDGLPIQEDTGLSYQSEHEGVMHACGHDVHASWTVGAAALLKESPPKGDVLILLQPAEELARGALEVLKSGELDGVSAIFGGHVDRHYPVGKVVVHHGAIAANSDTFNITLIGKGSHGARPHEGNSPLIAVSDIVATLSTLVQDVVGPEDTAVVSVGAVQAGHVHNVIPGEAFIKGTIRSLNQEVRQRLHQTLKKRVLEILDKYKLKGGAVIDAGAPAITNEKEFYEIAHKSVKEVCGDDGVTCLKEVNLGAEDFGYYLQKIPGCFLRFGARYETDPFIPAHNPQFIAEDETIFVGARVLEQCVRVFFS